MEKRPSADKLPIGGQTPLTIIAGPCVIEDWDTTFEIAAFLKKLTDELELSFIFKASFDKANRTSIHSYRGPGMEKGLGMLSRIKSEAGVHIISDVHEVHQVDAAANVLDIIQIPAFLCRQTDILLAAGKTGRPINIKKGQFLAPWDVVNIIDKVKSTGNTDIVLTERGNMFGYNNLVVDFRGIPIMQSFGCPVIFDATHSVQLPGGAGGSSGGQREYAPTLAKAAVAAGADGVFLEVHPDPDNALCDGPNTLPLNSLKPLFQQLTSISQAIRT
jgi:2-dehydro-3-deoxyphosphooctonate aldolase (KDO 8-P synthase)